MFYQSRSNGLGDGDKDFNKNTIMNTVATSATICPFSHAAIDASGAYVIEAAAPCAFVAAGIEIIASASEEITLLVNKELGRIGIKRSTRLFIGFGSIEQLVAIATSEKYSGFPVAFTSDNMEFDAADNALGFGKCSIWNFQQVKKHDATYTAKLTAGKFFNGKSWQINWEGGFPATKITAKAAEQIG